METNTYRLFCHGLCSSHRSANPRGTIPPRCCHSWQFQSRTATGTPAFVSEDYGRSPACFRFGLEPPRLPISTLCSWLSAILAWPLRPIAAMWSRFADTDALPFRPAALWPSLLPYQPWPRIGTCSPEATERAQRRQLQVCRGYGNGPMARSRTANNGTCRSLLRCFSRFHADVVPRKRAASSMQERDAAATNA
jgi:hypothetical protein